MYCPCYVGISSGITTSTNTSNEFPLHDIHKQRRVKCSFASRLLVPSVGNGWGDRAVVSLLILTD